ncbi:MAG: hypothetical protein CM1200mP28_12140 [Deltaproteobacteria bacterium]|nr:MAG: hypothetical protein CM1200mP28_12140 [Deltaproteobacteria bacterium]
MAQQEGDAILRRDSNVDFVFGTDNLFELPGSQKSAQGGKIPKTQRYEGRRYIIFFRNILFKNFSIPESKLI